jgi:hypothetical protein
MTPTGWAEAILITSATFLAVKTYHKWNTYDSILVFATSTVLLLFSTSIIIIIPTTVLFIMAFYRLLYFIHFPTPFFILLQNPQGSVNPTPNLSS